MAATPRTHRRSLPPAALAPLAPFALALGLGPVGLAGRAVAHAATHAQQAAQPVPTFGSGTELVYLRFHVERKGGGYVTALRPEQVRVLEDGRPQRIALLETPSTRVRTVPPEVTLALDVSSSVMDARLLDEALVRDVLLASLGGEARVGLCAFGGELLCPTAPTRDPAAVMDGFRQALRFGAETRLSGTRLYASLAEIASGAQTVPGGGATAGGGHGRAQRALIVFSDGLDNRGGRPREAAEAARSADVRVYTVTLSQAFQDTASSPLLGRAPNRAMFDYRKFELAGLAEDTGGRNFEPGSLDTGTLRRILGEIASEISMENVVGYEPQGEPSGRRVKVKVELVDKALGRVRNGERTLAR